MNRIGLLLNLAGGRAREREERGQVLVVFALALVALLASAGLVIDLGGSWAQVRTEQKVADVAALAGATAEANGASRAAIIQAATDSAVAKRDCTPDGGNRFPGKMRSNHDLMQFSSRCLGK